MQPPFLMSTNTHIRNLFRRFHDQNTEIEKMLNKHKYGLALLSLCCSSAAFAVQIESRGLSQGSTPTAVAMNVGSANVPTNLNWQMMEKITQMEADIRSLRGKMEEQENTIDQLKKELENRYTDLDARLEILQEKVDPTEPEAETPTEVEDNQQGTAPSTTLNTTQQQDVALNVSLVSEEEKVAYTAALDAYKSGGAKKAIQPMQAFIQQYPNSAYISNAHFWLAEFLLAVDPTDFNAVKQNFTTVVNKYPNSAKASNALYRLFTIASNVDQNVQLAEQYKKLLLSHYPNSEEAKFVQ